MDSALLIDNLHKTFGKRRALNGLSMAIPRNSVSGFVGANGAGKTTTFSLVGGFFRWDAGAVEIEGLPLADYRRQGGIVGMLPQDVLFFEQRNVERQLLLYAKLAGLSGARAWAEVERVLGLVNLADRPKSLASDLSHGMKVRLGIAKAFVGNPPLVLLDEPTAGLDPKMVVLFKRMIDGLRGKTTIVISSHDLSQLEMICDYVCIIEKGELVCQGPIKELLSRNSRIQYHLATPVHDLKALQDPLPEFSLSQRDDYTLIAEFKPEEFSIPEVNSRVLYWLFKLSIGVLNIESRRTLEQTYLEQVEDEK